MESDLPVAAEVAQGGDLQRDLDGEDAVPEVGIRAFVPPIDLRESPAPNEHPPPSPPVDRPAKMPCVTVEEVDDEDEPFTYDHIDERAGETLGRGVTFFESMQTEQQALRQPPHSPFRDEDDWELATWLVEESTQSGIDRYLKLKSVSNRFSDMLPI